MTIDLIRKTRYYNVAIHELRIFDMEVIVMRLNIEAERGRLRMTKTELCNRLGVTLKTYNGYIQGKSMPSATLEKMKALTGTSIDYLLEDFATDDDQKTA